MQFPLGLRQRDIDDLQVAPAEPRLLLPDRLGHFRLRLEGDDGNDIPGDGCQECAKDSIVFVSSEYYQGFALEGLYGADQRCRSLAGKAGLPRHLTYKAWLSDGSMDAADRLDKSMVPYIRPDKVVVADNWTALTTMNLKNPINKNESNAVVNGNMCNSDALVWTNTNIDGTAKGGDHCADWQDQTMGPDGLAGLAALKDIKWTDACTLKCDVSARLYCFEQPVP